MGCRGSCIILTMTYSRLTEDICRSLDVLPDAPEEGRGIASVTNSMIICQGKRDNWPHDDSAGDNPGSVHDTADPEDRDFWVVMMGVEPSTWNPP